MGCFRLTSFGLVMVLLWCYAKADFLNDRYEDEPDSAEHGVIRGAKNTTCKCGWANKDSGRIVGGKVTKPNEYPYMATFIFMRGYKNEVMCGGTIITKKFVITAAHCTERFYGDCRNLAVYVGAHDTSSKQMSNGQQLHRIKKIHQHESYRHEGYLNDIALLETATDIQFNTQVGPACLPTGTEKLLGKWVKVTGWGHTSWEGEGSPVLKKLNVKVVDLKECSRYFAEGYINYNVPKQFCTYKPNEDSCQGDSGGPLTYLDPETNRYTLVGLVSYGWECASRNPSVNTHVYSYMPWILRIISLFQAGSLKALPMFFTQLKQTAHSLN